MGDLEELCLNLTLELVPFFNIFREDMEENINSLAKDLEKCCVENPDVEIIHTGSGFEGLSLPHLERQTAWNTDADHMIIRTDLKLLEGGKLQGQNIKKSEEHAVGSSVSSANEDQGHDHFVYIFDAGHAGYVHMTHRKHTEPIKEDLIREHCLENSKFIEESKDLIPLKRSVLMALGDGSITGPSYSLPYTGGTFVVNRDFVYGLKCTFWPSQAQEWINRERNHCWPSAAVVSSISAQGCHIVPVGSTY